jgi:hypothetical protein
MSSPFSMAWGMLKMHGDLFWDRLLLLHHEHGEEAALRYIVEQGGFPPQEAPALLAEALKPDNQMRDEAAEEYDAQGNEGE